ncbi:hypothetical protein RB625_31250 [Streptomyces californicus]|uniref:hypothetical protein n=1 Tax=Streptomyces californicus TaxID=67351 RepID=UPI00296E4AF9|nr:hypothetical protein [Streptomyces californicus]MDW4902901.1 hypothetical protein [Streptomyces californicus]
MNPAHLVEMTARSVGRSQALMELALAWTVATRPYVSGTRGLGRWAGLTSRMVRETVGPEGGHSENKLLWTRTRGASSPTAEEREQMEIRFHANTRTQGRSTSPKNLSTPISPLGDLALKEELEKIMEGSAPLSARISERAQEVLVNGMKTLSRLTELSRTNELGQILTALDPGLDIWAETERDGPAKVALEPLGRRAWHLGVLCGLEDVVLSVADIEVLTGLSKRGAQALLKRMTEANPALVEKVRQGRSIAYGIRWASNYRMGSDLYDDASLRDEIRKARGARDREVQATSARRGTPAGYLAYRLSTASPKRDAYLEANPLPADADATWSALVEAGDEMALYEYLKGQEAEVGPVPSTPEALVEKTVEWRPARESLETAAVSKETLAEMRKRVIAWSR